MPCLFLRKRFGNHPQAELLTFQSSFAVGDQCFQEIRLRLVEETKVCTPRHVADDVDSSFPHLGSHRRYLPNFIFRKRVSADAIAKDRSAELQRRISSGSVGDGASHCAIGLPRLESRQSWVPPPAFRREPSYRRNLNPTRVASVGWAPVKCPPHSMPLLLSYSI